MTSTLRHRTAVGLLLGACLLSGLVIGACASNPVRSSPQALAHYGANIVEGMRDTTKQVIALNAAGVLNDDLTRKVLNQIDQANNAAGRLESALRLYDAATNLVAKQDALINVSKLLNETNALFALAFNVEIPPGVLGQINTLTSNVNRIILDVQLEIAKVRTT